MTVKKLQIYMALMMFTVSPACGSPPIFEGEISSRLQDAHTGRVFTEFEVRGMNATVFLDFLEPSPWIPIIWRLPSGVDLYINEGRRSSSPVIPWLPNPFTEDLSLTWESALNNHSPFAKWQEKKNVAAAGYTASGRDKLFRLNAYPAAIADFDKALSLTPEAPRVYDARATAKLQFGNAEAAGGNTAQAQRHYHAAIQDYTQVIARSPERTDAYLFRGYAAFKLGTLEADRGNAKQARHHHHAAIADGNHAMALSRKNASVLKEALALHTDLGVASKEAMEIRGSYAFAHYVRGLAKEALGHHTAAADFRKAKALRLVPEGRPWTFLVESKFGRVNLR